MDTKKLRAELERVTKPNGRRYFSEELRAKIVKAVLLLREKGASQAKIADELTISPAAKSCFPSPDLTESHVGQVVNTG